MRRRLALAAPWTAVAIAIAVVLVIALVRGTSSSRGRAASGADDPSSGSGVDDPSRARTTSRGGAQVPGVDGVPASAGPAATAGDPAREERLTQRADRVSQAIALLRFAPDSQPLRADMKDLLQPNRRHESPMPLSFATGNTKDPPRPGDLSFLFTGDVYAVVSGGSLTATLEVFREHASGSSERERVAVDVTASTLSVVEASGARVVASGILPSDDGREGDVTSGDKIYGVALVPSTIAGLAGHRGLARLDVEFIAAEGDRKPARASLDFRVSGTAPATFSGVANERLTADGLEITADLHVDEPGPYFVQGLLFDARDAPIGFATARPTLGKGRALVPLLFWGLLFHEAKAGGGSGGPFVFKTLTGHRMPAAGEPDRVDMAAWSGPYRTKAYSLGDFSEKEYESAAKEAKLKALADLAARNHGAAPASSATP